LPAAGTELAVKPKGRAAQARRRHYYTVQISIIIAPLRNRVILFHLFFPTLPVGQGSGRFPSRGIGPPHRIASLMQGASDYHHLIDCWSVAMWSSSRPLRALRVGVLSPPCESSDRQFTRIIHVRLFSIARPGKCLPHIVLQPGFLSHLPLDSRPRPRQGLKACQVSVIIIVAGTYLTRLLCFAFAWPDAVMTACCCCLCFRTSA
jgi:hypothetical protein